MIEGGAPFEPKGSLRDLLSEEEFREILAPYPGDGGGAEDVVLVLGDDPEDAERISAYLLPRGARAHPVTDRFIALDELRSHDFRAFIAEFTALGPDPSHYLERVRETRSPLRFGFIAAAETAIPAWLEEEGPLARRPLDEAALARLLPWAGTGAAPGGEGPPPFAPQAPPPAAPPRAARGAPNEPVRAPDWLAAVRALLEARRAGEPLDEALRRWAEREPGCSGWGEVRDQGGTLAMRAGGTDRAALLAALAREVAAQPEPPALPASRGDFGCLPGAGGWTAFRWREPAAARHGWERFAELLPRIDALRPPAAGAPPAGSAPRDRLLRILDARMHGITRHGGSLALLLVEPAEPEGLLPLVEALGGQLRGEDWLELESGRLWVILERPGPGVAAAVGARLRAAPGGESLRALGASWRPGGERAQPLVERLERDIGASGTVQWVD